MITSEPLTEIQKKEWTNHVLSSWPDEACAYIVDGSIFPVKNINPEPLNKVSVSSMDRFEANKGEVTAFLHSHPSNRGNVLPPEWPSMEDMIGWLAETSKEQPIRWGISVTDGEAVSEPIWMDENYIAPLEGRYYIMGIWDCWSAVRDWYRVKLGITYTNYPRDYSWYTKEPGLLERRVKDAGFIEINEKLVEPNDVALINLGSRQPVHMAVVADDLNFFHHTYTRQGQALSGFTPRGKWIRQIARYVRHAEIA